MGIIHNNDLFDRNSMFLEDNEFLRIDLSQLPRYSDNFTCIPVDPSLWKTEKQWEEELAKGCEMIRNPVAKTQNPTMDDIISSLMAGVDEHIHRYYRSAVAVWEQKQEDGLLLHLSLKEQWYRLIESGDKTEEYRLINAFWAKRLVEKSYCANGYVPMVFIKPYSRVEFSLGYPKRDDWSRRMLFEIKSISIGRGNICWGAPADEDVFRIELGNRLK